MVEGARAQSPARAGRVVPFGAPAVEALLTAVGGAKASDPLAPVTVIVTSALAAVTVRRRLASRNGIVALDTVVLPGLATRLAGNRVAADGRRPLSGLQSAALARAVLVRERARSHERGRSSRDGRRAVAHVHRAAFARRGGAPTAGRVEHAGGRGGRPVPRRTAEELSNGWTTTTSSSWRSPPYGPTTPWSTKWVRSCCTSLAASAPTICPCSLRSTSATGCR